MNLWNKYKSPLGYYNNDNQIDSYGVNHSGFSIRDELNYQFARKERENNLMEQLQNQGTKTLPQYTTDFWNKPAQNNYGFGSSNIEIPTNTSPETYTTENIPPHPLYNTFANTKPMTLNGTNLNGQERVNALKNGQSIVINVEDTDNLQQSKANKHIHILGKEYVEKYSNLIEKYAQQYNLNPNIVKAILYTEASDYHKYGLDFIADSLGVSTSIRPMNIQGKTWGSFQGTNYDVTKPEQNIELGVRILKAIYDAVPDKDIAKIATLWNGTGKNYINEYGKKTKEYYSNQSWNE